MFKSKVNRGVSKPRSEKATLFAFSASLLLIPISFVISSQAGFQARKTLQDVPISPACGVSQQMSQAHIFGLIEEGHHQSSENKRVRCPGFFAEIDAPAPGVLALEDMAFHQKQLSEANDCNIRGPLGDQLTAGEKSGSQGKEDLIQELINKTDANQILQTMTTLSAGALGPTRYHDSTYPRKTPEWILEQFKKIAGKRTDIRIRLVEHVKTPQPSVEAIIEGVGPDKNKFVVIGGHQDSIHGSNSHSFVDSPAPGADDNASGVGTVLEAFRVLVESGIKPNASIAFYTYAAEEVGLVGSQEVARSYSNSGKEVLGVVQVDMASYTSGPTDEITFITDFTSSTLTATAADLAVKYLGMKVSYDTCGYACSDHASWTRYNFRSILPAEKEVWTSARRIHTTQDTIDTLVKPAYAEKFSKLSIAMAVTLGFH